MKRLQPSRVLSLVGLVAAIVLCAAPGVRAASDLIGYWNFDEATGSTIADGSTNGNDGTIPVPVSATP